MTDADHFETFHALPAYTLRQTGRDLPRTAAGHRSSSRPDGDVATPAQAFPQPGGHHHQPGEQALPAAADVAWRLDCYHPNGMPFAELWQRFMDRVSTTEVRALVIGPWWHYEYTPLRPALELILSDRVQATVGAAGTEVDLSEQQVPDEEWRYVAVS